MGAGAQQQWAGTTYGSGRMHRWLTALLRVVGVRLPYLFAAVCVVPFCMAFGRGGRIIYRYFRQRIGMGRLRSLWMAYANHCLFGQVVIDRFAMYGGRRFDTELEGYEHFQRLSAQPEGFVQLSAHVGNYELAGYTLVAADKPFNALVFFGEKESVMQGRSKMFARTHIRMIPIKPDMSHLFLLNDALVRGEIVNIPADRIYGSEKYIEKEFLGRKAHFPMGPFSIATARQLDVLFVNVLKVGVTKYKIIVAPLAYDKSAARAAQVDELAEQYVRHLESIVRAYPAQWYNYYEFWT